MRNRYACMPALKQSNAKRGQPITFELPDGEVIKTDLARGRMLRWRGWGPVYVSAGATAGDVLRYVAVGPRHYTVRVVRR